MNNDLRGFGQHVAVSRRGGRLRRVPVLRMGAEIASPPSAARNDTQKQVCIALENLSPPRRFCGDRSLSCLTFGCVPVASRPPDECGGEHQKVVGKMENRETASVIARGVSPEAIYLFLADQEIASPPSAARNDTKKTGLTLLQKGQIHRGARKER